ncbi:uncharacterized protein LOC134193338 [Corticium candelabrum]|uniref:uncharacterized protein LOC134193338 n=1 Tax=Corticium candelabrum TaxID=121492 RepID=UPI002E25B12D|nr:uncharacterized protein LOC134193338 [Corticium candelabrum]
MIDILCFFCAILAFSCKKTFHCSCMIWHSHVTTSMPSLGYFLTGLRAEEYVGKSICNTSESKTIKYYLSLICIVISRLLFASLLFYGPITLLINIGHDSDEKNTKQGLAFRNVLIAYLCTMGCYFFVSLYTSVRNSQGLAALANVMGSANLENCTNHTFHYYTPWSTIVNMGVVIVTFLAQSVLICMSINKVERSVGWYSDFNPDTSLMLSSLLAYSYLMAHMSLLHAYSYDQWANLYLMIFYKHKEEREKQAGKEAERGKDKGNEKPTNSQTDGQCETAPLLDEDKRKRQQIVGSVELKEMGTSEDAEKDTVRVNKKTATRDVKLLISEYKKYYLKWRSVLILVVVQLAAGYFLLLYFLEYWKITVPFLTTSGIMLRVSAGASIALMSIIPFCTTWNTSRKINEGSQNEEDKEIPTPSGSTETKANESSDAYDDKYRLESPMSYLSKCQFLLYQVPNIIIVVVAYFT